MPWRPLPRTAVAIAIYPFAASSPADLPLEIGDDLYIIEQGGKNGEWLRGYLVAPPSLLTGLTTGKGQSLEARVFCGIFPKCCVEIREHLGEAISEPYINGLTVNGDSPKREPVHGDSNRQLGGHSGRASVRREESTESLRKRHVAAKAATQQESGAPQHLLATPSKALARKLSHRSITSSRSRNSPLSTTPIPDDVQDLPKNRPQAPLPMLKIGDETPTSAAEPLVDEIASCLREWHSKNLHVLLLSRRYQVLDELSGLVNRLSVARKQLLFGVMTDQELTHLREELVWDLVGSNKMLSNEVIVRDPVQGGRLLTGDDSPVELSKLQSAMSLLDRPPKFNLDPIGLHHLLVELRGFTYSGLVAPAATIQLFTQELGEKPVPLTEIFAIEVPTKEDFENQAMAYRLRTLFVDLTSGDLEKGSQSGSDLYLVVRLQASVPVQEPPRRKTDSSPARPANTSLSGSLPTKGGRQSLMWAQKQLGSVRQRNHGARSSPMPSSIEETSTQSMTSRPATTKSHTEDRSGSSIQRENQYARKYLGAGVIRLNHVIGNKGPAEFRIPIWEPSTGNSGPEHKSSDQWDDVVADIVPSRTGSHARAKYVDEVHLSLQLFENSDAQDLIARTPTLLQNVVSTPKISFSGTPSRSRSDIYVKINEASLPPQALLAHPERGTSPFNSETDLRNLQLTLEVRKGNGKRVERCIFPSSNSQGYTAWRTSTVTQGQPWSELIKVVLSAETVTQCHLIMSVANAPGFPFALGWIPLWIEGAFIRDGAHVPLLYVYDKTTSGSDNSQSPYLTLPWSSKGKDGRDREESVTGPVATLKLETQLCSTFLSQDPILLGLLKWRQQPSSEVLSLLKCFSFIPEIDIIKMIGDVFNALFGILENNSGNSDFEDEVFHALVLVLGIVYDRRFNLGPFVDGYAETTFDHPGVASCLIRSYSGLLSNSKDPDQSRLLRSAFKVGRQILKFVLRSREKQSLEEAVGGATTASAFKRELSGLFWDFEKLMRDQTSTLIGNRTLVVQHMSSWLPELRPAFSDSEVLDIATRFVESCSNVQGKLLLHKLVLILTLNDQSLLRDPTEIKNLTIATTKWIGNYWGPTDQVTDQWQEQVRLCCSIATKLVNRPGYDGAHHVWKAVQSYCALARIPLGTNDTLSLLFPTAYPFPSKALSSKSSFAEARLELAAFLALVPSTSLRLPETASTVEVAGFVSSTLDVITSILSGGAFPQSWISLFVYHHRSMLRILESLFDALVGSLIPTPEDAYLFNTELWEKYLTTLLALIRSNTLALETFPEQKRRAVWKVAGDVRELGSELLRRSWEVIGWDTNPEEVKKYGLNRLGGFQVQYVPKLVGPIVELCLSIHEDLRSVAIKILQSMIISEWTLNEDLVVVQAEIIESLDRIFKARNFGESVVQKMFINELLDSFETLARMPLDPLWQAVRNMLSTLDELLELLGSVHSADISENLRIMNTLQLMNFLKDMQKEDIFIRYVHQLAKVQAAQGNKTEAGLALALHAEQYVWSAARVIPLFDPVFPEQSSFARKEQLYFHMIRFFEEGNAWENALTCYQDLAKQYETTQYDFAKLARTQRSMATIYGIIAKGDWQPPRYFKVVYHGADFPASLRDKTFIYEAGPNERQSAFADRMRQLHPDAQVISKGAIDELTPQCVQVSPISPYRDLEHPIYQQAKVAQSTRDYLTCSKVYRFAITSKRHSPSSGVHDQWIEKTVYSTQDVFPTILRRSEVIAVDVVRLTPMETAVEKTTRKSSELASIEKRFVNGDEPVLSSFLETIAFSVDSNSPASVAQYRELLRAKSDSSGEEEDDEAAETIADPIENALRIAILDHVSLLKHCLLRPVPSSHQSTVEDLNSKFQKTFASELATLLPNTQTTSSDSHQLFSSPPGPSLKAPTSSNFEPPLDSSANNNTVLPDQDFHSIEDRPRPFSKLNPNMFKGSFGSSANGKEDQMQPTIQQQRPTKSPPSIASNESRNHSLQQSHQPVKSMTSLGSAPQPTQASSSIPNGNGSTNRSAVPHVISDPERPLTAQSSGKSSFVSNSSGRVKRRLSKLGIGRSGSTGSGSSGGRAKSRDNAVRVSAIQE